MQQAQETVLPPSLRGEYPRQLVRRSEVLPDGRSAVSAVPRASSYLCGYSRDGHTLTWRGGLVRRAITRNGQSRRRSKHTECSSKNGSRSLHASTAQTAAAQTAAAKPVHAQTALRRPCLAAHREVRPPAAAPEDRAMQWPSAAALRRLTRPGHTPSAQSTKASRTVRTAVVCRSGFPVKSLQMPVFRQQKFTPAITSRSPGSRSMRTRSGASGTCSGSQIRQYSEQRCQKHGYTGTNNLPHGMGVVFHCIPPVEVLLLILS